MSTFSAIRSRIRSIDPALWLVLALCLIAAWAFILRPSLPRETDAELHVFRAAEIGYNIRAGALYSRWAPDFYYGYGYPIFNYYAPLTYYLANVLTLFIPSGAVLGVKLVFVLGFIIAGVSVYFLGKRLTSRFGGLLAAASFLFSPYFYLINPHLRGDLAEYFALALGPLAFWQMTRHFDAPRPQTLIVSTLCLASIILTHNLLALVFFAMLLAYTLWSFLFKASRPQSFRAGVVRCIPLVLALLVSAFFWIPVGLEQDAVQLSNLIGPGHFDYRNHFLTLGELFGPVVPLDLGAANPEFRLNVGLPQWLLAFGGLILAIRRATSQTIKGETRQTLSLVFFWGLAGLFLILLMLPLSRPLWDLIPQMAFLQFPWRLLGPANICLALLAAFLGEWDFATSQTGWKRSITAVLFALPLIGILPVFSPPDWESFGPTDRQAMLEFELSGIALGTTATGDFVPTAVELVPAPNPDLLASYQSGGHVDKVNRRTLPAGTSVEIISHQPTQDRFQVDTDDAFVLRLYTFMFAGWKASIDGEPVAIEVAQPEGFITVQVPEGSHEVRVWLGSTPARNFSIGLTIIGLLTLAITARSMPVSSGAQVPNEAQPYIEGRVFTGILGCFILLAGLGTLIGLFQPESADLTVSGADYLDHSYFEGGADLLGYDISQTDVFPGDEITVTLYWKAREPVSGNYQSFLHLTTEPQLAWAQSDNLNPGDYPTSRWPLDKYVRDEHVLRIPEATPPGSYSLRTGLWNHLSGVRQLVLEEDGTILGDALNIGPDIIVHLPDEYPRAQDIEVDLPLDISAADDITLHGVTLMPSSRIDFPAGYLVITLFWEAGFVPDLDYELAIRLISPDTSTIVSESSALLGGNYPSSSWMPGMIVRDMHSLWVGPDVEPNLYDLQIALSSSSAVNDIDWQTIATIERSPVLP